MLETVLTYSACVYESFAKQRRRLLESNFLAAVVRHGADRAEKQLVLESDLFRLTVVLDVHVNRHREAAVAGLRHLVRRFFDHCNTQHNEIQTSTKNKSSAVAEMAAQCCTSRIAKRWE